MAMFSFKIITKFCLKGFTYKKHTSYKNLWFWGYLLNSFGSEGSELSSLRGPGTQTNPVLYFSDRFSDSSATVTASTCAYRGRSYFLVTMKLLAER